MFRDKAAQLGERMLPAFQTETGIPHSLINLHTGVSWRISWSGVSLNVLKSRSTMPFRKFYNRLEYIRGGTTTIPSNFSPPSSVGWRGFSNFWPPPSLPPSLLPQLGLINGGGIGLHVEWQWDWDLGKCEGRVDVNSGLIIAFWSKLKVEKLEIGDEISKLGIVAIEGRQLESKGSKFRRFE